MSSAKQRLRRVGIGGLSAAVGATVMFGLAAAPANASWTAVGFAQQGWGPTNFGIDDTSPQTGNNPDNPVTPGAPYLRDDITAPGDAPLVMPGQTKQKLAPVKLLIPNAAFTKGDFIDVYLYARDDAQTAGGNGASAGMSNTGDRYKLGFDSAGTVSVGGPFKAMVANQGPSITDQRFGSESVEGLQAFTGNKAPTDAPQFTTSLAHTIRAGHQGTSDILRLTVDNDATINSNPNAVWEVTISGLTAEVGTDVAPGALRVAPFLYNKGAIGADKTLPADDNPVGSTPGTNLGWFGVVGGVVQGPSPAPAVTDDTGRSHQSPAGYDVRWGNDNIAQALINLPGYTRTGPANISTYSIVGYVAPATITQADPTSIVADDTFQKVGDITLTETASYGLQPGRYTLTMSHVEADSANKPTVSVATAPTGPTINPDQVTNIDFSYHPGTDTSTLKFTLKGGNGTTAQGVDMTNLTKSTITFGNIYLKSGSSSSPRSTYVLTGGSVNGDYGDDAFLTPNGTSGDIGQPDIAPYGQFGVEAQAVTNGQYSFSYQAPGQYILPPTFQVEGPDVGVRTDVNQRIGGSDRYGTAAKIALADNGCNASGCVQGGGNPNIVIASGENFPDAMSANYLASALQTDILLVKKNNIPQATADALRILGVNHVFIVGGQDAISSSVASTLDNTKQYLPGGTVTVGQGNLQVTRQGGANRYETNQMVNQFAAAQSLNATAVGATNFKYGDASKPTALVATGDDWPDAVAAGAAVNSGAVFNSSGGYPLVLTKSSGLTPQAQATLTNLGIKQVVVVGGPDVMPASVTSAISGLGIAVKQVGGDNRYATAAALADLEVLPLHPTVGKDGGFGFPSGADADILVLATGEKYADALAGGPYAAKFTRSPILLTKSASLSPETQKWMQDHASLYRTVQALGLGQAVSDAALSAANLAIAH